MISEISLQNQIRLVVSEQLPNITLWRNEVGAGRTPGGGFIRFGLCPGSADLIGIKRPTGQFIAIEVKLPGQKLRSDQAHFLEWIHNYGGIAGVVTSVEQALALLS